MTEEKLPDVGPPEPKPCKTIPAEDGVFENYGNQVNLAWTLFDVTLRFGQIVPAPGDMPPWANMEVAAITIPWGQAKALRDMLNDLVLRCEKANGEIKPISEMRLP